jgi:hypothetical protein
MLTWLIWSYIKAENHFHNSWYAHRLSYRSAITLRSSVFWQHVALHIHTDVSEEVSASGFRVEVISVRMTRTNTLNMWRYRRRWRQYVPLERRYASARIYGVTFQSSHTKFYGPIYRLPSARSYASKYTTHMLWDTFGSYVKTASLLQQTTPNARVQWFPKQYTTMKQRRGTRASVGIAVLYFVDKI